MARIYPISLVAFPSSPSKTISAQRENICGVWKGVGRRNTPTKKEKGKERTGDQTRYGIEFDDLKAYLCCIYAHPMLPFIENDSKVIGKAEWERVIPLHRVRLSGQSMRLIRRGKVVDGSHSGWLKAITKLPRV